MGKHKYSNDKITVTWDSEVCIHSGVCVKNLGSVFDTKKKPWVNVDGASVDEITSLIKSCPSGALAYKLSSESNAGQEKSTSGTEKTKVTISKNGPYLVKGDFSVEDADGNPVETKGTAVFCRCGSSSNKPFCDGSHKKVGFVG